MKDEFPNSYGRIGDVKSSLGFGLRDILDALPFWAMVVDADRRILMVNRLVEKESDAEEIAGKDCIQVMGELGVPHPDRLLEEAMERGHAVERELSDPHSGRWMEAAIYPLEHKTQDGRDAFLFTARDITERKRAEEEREQLLAQVQKRARQMQQIMDAMPDGMLLLNADHHILLANPAAREHLAVLTDKKVGDTLTHLGPGE